MKILYIIYQVCFALPILLVLTILTALVTIIGSLIGGAHTWGYYPGKIWSQLICYILLIPVEVHGREKIHKRTSYVFVPNHQGAFDIFLIYGFLGRNFKWMMKKSLRKIPFVGKACESAGHIFVDRSSPKKVLATMRQAESSLKHLVEATRWAVSSLNFARVRVISRCLGPVASAVMKGRLIWLLIELDSSIFAFSAASFRR